MSSRRRRRSQPKAVGTVIGSVMEDLGLDAVARAFRVGESWDDAVGAVVASHAQPLGMRGGVLEVQVDTSVWCQQLQMRRPQLLAALRESLGEDAPGDLHFRVGYTPPNDGIRGG